MKKLLLLSIMVVLAFSTFTSTASAYYKESSWFLFKYKCSGCYKAAALRMKTRIYYDVVWQGYPMYKVKSVWGRMSNYPGYSNPYVFDTQGRIRNNGYLTLLSNNKNWPNGYLKKDTGWFRLGTTTLYSVPVIDHTYGRFLAYWSYGSRKSTEIKRIRSASL